MGNALFHWILVGIMIKMTESLEISDSNSGSKSCNLTLRFNPSPVFFKTGYQSFEIFKHPNALSDYSPLHCRVHSVKILRGFQEKFSLKRKFFTRKVIKKHNTKLEVILQHRDFKNIPVEEAFVLVELECNGRRCSLRSPDTLKKSISQSSWIAQRRKLLSLRIENRVDNMDHPLAAPVLVAVVGIIVLIVALAMCACGNNTREKALSDELGGTEVDHHVVAVSSVHIEEGQKITEHVTHVKNENESSSGDRRNTNESKKSERNSQSATENGAVNSKGRTASQSSQPEKRSMGEVEPLPHSSGSRNSVDKIEETPLGSSSPEKGTESVTPERKRTASDKESPNNGKGSKENISSSEARTRTDSSEGSKKKLRMPSRKRQGSDGKEPKSSPEEHAEQKTKFWQRRKSSKTKANIENTENISPKKEKKKKSQKNQTPEHVPSSSRPAHLPLPPPPSSAVDEEAQYEVVESRAQRPKSNSGDADYETVTTSKTRTYDKVNILPKDQSRPASELYECINDQDTKMKRVSSGSNQYDVVETRSPPKKPAAVGLEYAYAVLASRDKPPIPTETSNGSGLYEVVTDDIKQQSGVLDTQKSDIVVEDADYAVVQKDPSKKLSSKKEEDEQRKKSLSGDIHPAPAPPPVSSLIHVSASVRRRTQSEGDELNVERADSPFDPSSTLSDRPQTMFEIDQTYAKVNLAAKKRHSVEAPPASHDFAPASALPEGFYEESETPPPIPPSLYADLESMRKDGDEENDTSQSPSSSTQPKTEFEENAYEEVTTKVEIKSITSRPTVSDLKITQGKEIIDNQKEYVKSPEDPNGVLKRLKPPLGSPRNSDGRLSASSLEGEKRFSTASQHNYDEVLTKTTKTTQTTSGHYESIENKTKRNSAGYEVFNAGQKPTTSSGQTEDNILTYV